MSVVIFIFGGSSAHVVDTRPTVVNPATINPVAAMAVIDFIFISFS
jgi:hypothetical protein